MSKMQMLATPGIGSTHTVVKKELMARDQGPGRSKECFLN